MRVATLAWNSQHHVEAWYAFVGMGAICRTLNPRLTTAQLVAMLAQSEARILIVSADLLPAAWAIADVFGMLDRILVINGVANVSQHGKAKIHVLDALLDGASTDVVWAISRRTLSTPYASPRDRPVPPRG